MKAAAWVESQVSGLKDWSAVADAGGRTRGSAVRNGRPVTATAAADADAGTITWLLVHDLKAPASPPSAEAADFVEALLTAAPNDDYGLALSRLSAAAKAKLGGSDNLRRQLLRPRTRGADEYTLAEVKPGEYAGEIRGPNRPAVKYRLRVAPAGPAWAVDDLTFSD